MRSQLCLLILCQTTFSWDLRWWPCCQQRLCCWLVTSGSACCLECCICVPEKFTTVRCQWHVSHAALPSCSVQSNVCEILPKRFGKITCIVMSCCSMLQLLAILPYELTAQHQASLAASAQDVTHKSADSPVNCVIACSCACITCGLADVHHSVSSGCSCATDS